MLPTHLHSRLSFLLKENKGPRKGSGPQALQLKSTCACEDSEPEGPAGGRSSPAPRLGLNKIVRGRSLD